MRAPAGVAILQLAAASAVAGKTLVMPWTTDSQYCFGSDIPRCGHVGSDGPWQALKIWVGDQDVEMPMWPTASYRSQVITTSANGDYKLKDSKSAEMQRAGDTSVDRLNGQDDWLSASFLNGTAEGIFYFDMAGIDGFHVDYLDDHLNMSMLAVNSWELTLPSGKQLNATVGNLGVGPRSDSETAADELPLGLLEQLKKNKDIESNAFSLHIGSVAMQQRPSMILGGYEQNRALGKVGVFNTEYNFPRSLLIDVSLGVETGGSPFNKTGSMWQGLGGDAEGAEMTETTGGRRGTAWTVPSAGSPYIYLPKGNCEAIAEQLPVSFDESLALYLWNTSDPAYTRIVNSPAYLGFTFADNEASNVTIKVPFKLLNLTIEYPLIDLADGAVSYFPCQPRDSEDGVWQLGRAFLQAAFLGMDYDAQKMYLAQAPGPDMAQSVTRDWEDGKVPRTNDADSFADTWKSSWTPLDGDDASSSQKDDDTNNSSNTNAEEDGESISPGAIAGIVIGCVAGLAALAALIWFFFFRRRRDTEVKQDLEEEEGFEMKKEIEGVHEMHSPIKTHEAPGQEMPHELHSPQTYHEMDGTGVERLPEDRKR
ncbi:aspartic-type endopeptidase [Sarocladium implicatum]|nr:aspartic-type endopeptidase [Sarocladium implicatum]